MVQCNLCNVAFIKAIFVLHIFHNSLKLGHILKAFQLQTRVPPIWPHYTLNFLILHKIVFILFSRSSVVTNATNCNVSSLHFFFLISFFCYDVSCFVFDVFKLNKFLLVLSEMNLLKQCFNYVLKVLNLRISRDTDRQISPVLPYT